MGKASLVFLLAAGLVAVRNRRSFAFGVVLALHRLVVLYLRFKAGVKTLLLNRQKQRLFENAEETNNVEDGNLVEPSIKHRAFRGMLAAIRSSRTSLPHLENCCECQPCLLLSLQRCKSKTHHNVRKFR